MRAFLLIAIRCYWRLVPKHRRRSCIFRETCSRHVYSIARDQGVRAGLAAFTERFRRCRAGFSFTFDEHMNATLLLADGSVVPLDDASDFLVAQAREVVAVIR